MWREREKLFKAQPGLMIGGLLCLGLALMFSMATRSVWAATLVKLDGSSTVYPVSEAVAEEFRAVDRRIQVTVGISGTGGGFKKFCRGEIDISDASRPIKASEIQLCEENGVRFIELPVAYDGLAVLVNKQNRWVESITMAELKKIWEPPAQGRITRWSQVRQGWPDRELHLFGPGVDSGTFDYFTEAVMGKAQASRGDYTASEDDNVLVQGIATDPNALGYFGLAYYEENRERLKLVAVDGGNGPVYPSAETVENGTYPLARPIFIYVSEAAAQRPEVDKFVRFYLDQAPVLAQEVGYIALPQRYYALAKKRFENRLTGSMYGGEHTVGRSLGELLKHTGK